MRQLAFILMTVIFFGCSQKRTSNNFTKSIETDSVVQSGELQLEPNSLLNAKATILKNNIDLNATLPHEQNEHLVSIDDSTLSLCCYQFFNIIPSIDFTRFNKTTEKYVVENQTKIVDVYFFEESFVKEYFNDHPEVMHEDLICGRIKNKELIANDFIQIGMTKRQFFDIFFQPTEIYEKFNRIDIYENELGESFTSYKFVNDTLKEILFDSVYDWIDKKLER